MRLNHTHIVGISSWFSNPQSLLTIWLKSSGSALVALTLNASQKTQNMLLPAVEFLKTFRTFRIHDGPDCKHRLWWHWWRLIGCLHWNPIHGPVFTLPPSHSELYQAHPQWYYSWPAPNWFCKHFSCIAQKVLQQKLQNAAVTHGFRSRNKFIRRMHVWLWIFDISVWQIS